MSGPSHDRLESSLQKAVQQVIARGLADPRVSGLISVTEVRVSGDGRTAVCKVSVMPHEREALTLKGLEHSAEHIRRRLDDYVQIARAPSPTEARPILPRRRGTSLRFPPHRVFPGTFPSRFTYS